MKIEVPNITIEMTHSEARTLRTVLDGLCGRKYLTEEWDVISALYDSLRWKLED